MYTKFSKFSLEEVFTVTKKLEEKFILNLGRGNPEVRPHKMGDPKEKTTKQGMKEKRLVEERSMRRTNPVKGKEQNQNMRNR